MAALNAEFDARLAAPLYEMLVENRQEVPRWLDEMRGRRPAGKGVRLGVKTVTVVFSSDTRTSWARGWGRGRGGCTSNPKAGHQQKQGEGGCTRGRA